MKIQARLEEGVRSYDVKPCRVLDVVELPYNEYSVFARNMAAPFKFIEEHAGGCWEDEKEAFCILVLKEDADDGILLFSRGEDTADKTAQVPGARKLVEKSVEELVQEIVTDGLHESTNGNKGITNLWLCENYDTQIFNSCYMEPLFKSALENHPDVESVTEGTWFYNLKLRPESCLALDEYHQPQRQLAGPTLQQLVNIGVAEFYIGVHGLHDEFTPARIPYLGPETLTPAGEAEWADVLGSEVGSVERYSLTGSDLCNQYNLVGISEQCAIDFGNLLAGNCTQEQQNLWVQTPVREANGYEWSHPQHEQGDFSIEMQ